jgi:hypothetical protein
MGDGLLCAVLKITEVAKNCGLLFPKVYILRIIFDRKKCIGLHFGRFFTSLSGHPVGNNKNSVCKATLRVTCSYLGLSAPSALLDSWRCGYTRLDFFKSGKKS